MDKGDMKKTLFTIATLVLLVACTNNVSTPSPTNNDDIVATIVAGTLSAISLTPTQTLMTIPTNTPVVDEWTWHNIDLYSLKLKLPPGWTINEVNRKPEPTEVGSAITGHDCAEYQITSADNFSVLFLRPVCGFAEGFPDSCPSDSIVISRQQEKFDVGRYFADGKFVYANSYVLSYSDLSGDHEDMVCTFPPVVSFTKSEGFVTAGIDFQYLGNETNIDQILTDVNEIILSISEQ